MSSSISPLAQSFTGVSKFAASLQSVLSRAVSIASLPLDSLNAGLNGLASKQAALQAIETPFLSLQQSIGALQNTVKSGLLNSSVSDAGIVTANVQQGALAGSYSIEVESLGSWSTALSNAGATSVADPTQQGISSSPTLTLQVGGVSTTITPSSPTLQGLVQAINAQASDQVQTTLVNVGSTAAPDYRLSLRAVNLGRDAIDLTDGTGDLISTSTTGTSASYKVAGLSAGITSNSRTVTLAPGLTVNLTGQSVAGQPTTINVVNSPTGLASAFSSFASSYNAAVDAVSQQHGANAGPLQGDSLLQSLSRVLTQLGTYSNGSAATALANYGITLDQSGHLSVNTTTFNAAANANFSGLLSTLGSSTTSGFLKTATDLLSGVEDPVTGSIRNEEATVSDAITAQQTRIANEQAVVSSLQQNLTAQIARADAAIASLESQVSYVTGLFAAYNGTSSTSTSNGLSTL
jgi:flagellar hook-associated protein 2